MLLWLGNYFNIFKCFGGQYIIILYYLIDSTLLKYIIQTTYINKYIDRYTNNQNRFR